MATPTVYSPSTESNAISLATRLRAGELLDNLTILLSADKESDLIRASTWVPGSQSLMATKTANASHVVLCFD